MPHKTLYFFLRFVCLLILLLSACSPEENTVPEQVLTSYETDSFFIQLPEAYMGSEPNGPGVNAIVAWMASNGQDAQGFSAFVRENASEMSFVAVDTQPSLSGSLTYFTLAGGERPEGFSIDGYVKTYGETAPEEKLLGMEEKELGNKQVDVLVYEFSNGEANFRNVIYFIDMEEENQLWKFEFVTEATDQNEEMEEFEQIVTDFRPKTGE